jgi:integrase
MKVMKSRLQLLKLKETSPAIETFNQEQVNQLISACDTLQDKFLIRLFYETGMWARQALELYREDVRLEENQINLVYRTHNANRARARLRKPNTIQVTQNLIELYLQYLETEYPKDLTSDYIFVNLKGRGIGRALTYNAVNQLFQRLSRKTGILASVRKFRYTHVSDLFYQGWPVELIKGRLGITRNQPTNKFFLLD